MHPRILAALALHLATLGCARGTHGAASLDAVSVRTLGPDELASPYETAGQFVLLNNDACLDVSADAATDRCIPVADLCESTQERCDVRAQIVAREGDFVRVTVLAASMEQCQAGAAMHLSHVAIDARVNLSDLLPVVRQPTLVDYAGEEVLLFPGFPRWRCELIDGLTCPVHAFGRAYDSNGLDHTEPEPDVLRASVESSRCSASRAGLQIGRPRRVNMVVEQAGTRWVVNGCIGVRLADDCAVFPTHGIGEGDPLVSCFIHPPSPIQLSDGTTVGRMRRSQIASAPSPHAAEFPLIRVGRVEFHGRTEDLDCSLWPYGRHVP